MLTPSNSPTYESVSLTTRLSRGPPTIQSPSPRCIRRRARTPIYIRRCDTLGTDWLAAWGMNPPGMSGDSPCYLDPRVLNVPTR